MYGGDRTHNTRHHKPKFCQLNYAHNTGSGIRTHTEGILSPAPLPLGYAGLKGFRPNEYDRKRRTQDSNLNYGIHSAI